ncbi:hypothetical protein M0R45_001896 [Rubus argutus]|uniref:Uncharacterized protein n=1 Tax=Rubus argutus TaxID=59490 RepID=A0AAW1VKJ8_RUBAR
MNHTSADFSLQSSHPKESPTPSSRLLSAIRRLLSAIRRLLTASLHFNCSTTVPKPKPCSRHHPYHQSKLTNQQIQTKRTHSRAYLLHRKPCCATINSDCGLPKTFASTASSPPPCHHITIISSAPSFLL